MIVISKSVYNDERLNLGIRLAGGHRQGLKPTHPSTRAQGQQSRCRRHDHVTRPDRPRSGWADGRHPGKWISEK